MTKDIQLDPDAMPSWLSRLWPASKYGPFLLAGINDDDCAIMRWDDDLLVVTTDYLNSSPIAVQLGIADESILGRLVVAANVADLLSTGATPRALLVGLTMPRNSTVSEYKRLMKGVKREADKLSLPVVGGDSKLGESLAVFAVAIGSASDRRELFPKNEAQPGDTVWVSGALGSCSAAVIGLCAGDISVTLQNWAKKVLTRPCLPLTQSQALAHSHCGHGGIDVSDGLGEDLHRLCEASGVGVAVDADNILIDSHAAAIAAAHALPPWALAFASGGDFQFIATASPRHASVMESHGFHKIGSIRSGRHRILRLPDRRESPLPRTGHRDCRNMSFHEEIVALAREASNA
jgi:thiamine-monophosphate kinase